MVSCHGCKRWEAPPSGGGKLTPLLISFNLICRDGIFGWKSRDQRHLYLMGRLSGLMRKESLCFRANVVSWDNTGRLLIDGQKEC